MSNKITDMLVSAIIKRGVLGEARNIDAEFDIPISELNSTQKSDILKNTKVHIKMEHVSIRIEKGT